MFYKINKKYTTAHGYYTGNRKCYFARVSFKHMIIMNTQITLFNLLLLLNTAEI